MDSTHFIEENETITGKQALAILKSHSFTVEDIEADSIPKFNALASQITNNCVDTETLFSWMGY